VDAVNSKTGPDCQREEREEDSASVRQALLCRGRRRCLLYMGSYSLCRCEHTVRCLHNERGGGGAAEH
jgi:hypothetical protein